MGETIDGYAVPIHRTEVDGIPCFWADLPGELVAHLTFRVGTYDETLATRGLTHLLEHLVAPIAPSTSYDLGGGVGGLMTDLWIHGDADEVVDGVAALARAIRNPPLDRLPAERRVLLCEGWDSSGALRTVLRMRYGARGPGLCSYPEYAVRRLTADEVSLWAQDRFTAGNAALWLTGPPPAGLACSLREGPRAPSPTPEPDPVELPALARGDDGEWGFGFVVRPSVVESIASEVLQQRLLARLRGRHGLTYHVRRHREPLADELDYRFLGGDVLNGYDDLALALALDELDALAERGPSDAELALEAGWARRYAANTDRGREWLSDVAESELLGRNPVTRNWLDEASALEPEDVAAEVRSWLASLVAVTASETPAEELGLHPAPGWNDDPIAGTQFRAFPAQRRASERLVIGDRAVSWVDDTGAATIRLDDLALMTRAVGERWLVRSDGFSITVETADWVEGRAAFALLDALVPPHLTVDLDVDGPEVPVYWPEA